MRIKFEKRTEYAIEYIEEILNKYKQYGKYPQYPVADAGYGSFNNYIYCEQHGMEKYIEFTMFEKETKYQKYRDNPYRIRNFIQDEMGTLICPKGRKFKYKQEIHVKGNKYGRTEEIYECESCENCEHKKDCCPKVKNNRSIQVEGTFGIIKSDKSYKRLRRKGLENVILEFT